MYIPPAFKDDDIESIRFKGPIDPATKRSFSGVFSFQRSATSRAIRAPARLMSRTAPCSP